MVLVGAMPAMTFSTLMACSPPTHHDCRGPRLGPRDLLRTWPVARKSVRLFLDRLLRVALNGTI
jgi:hypothetical protein